MKYYFVGIKGVGMVGLATIFKKLGHDVSGSDSSEEFITDRILYDLGIHITNFDTDHITQDINCVVYSSAYSNNHPQIKRAEELGIPTRLYIEALAEVFNTKKGIVVTGSHGKTTTTAMLGRVMEEAGLDPTVLVGGEVNEWGATSRSGTSEWFVVEGDEYQEKFLQLKPFGLLITNIDYDHPDYYPDKQSYIDAFKKLIDSVDKKGFSIINSADKNTLKLEGKDNISFYQRSLPKDSVGVSGEHNLDNASGVLAISEKLGIEKHIALRVFKNFKGTRRRMEYYTGENDDTVVIDDYAHHPAEIMATLKALRDKYPKRKIIAVFQPHTYSRTKVFLEDFAWAFFDADEVILTEIYSSARENKPDSSGQELANALASRHSKVEYAEDINFVRKILRGKDKTNTIIIFLGAGDLWSVAKSLKEEGLK